MSWFFFALGTAICWGMGYALSEKTLHAGVSSSFFLSGIYVLSLPFYFLLTWKDNTFRTSLEILSDKHTLFITLGAIAAYFFGNLFIMNAISLKNATHANMIEITYPLFTVLFTYLLFRQIHLDWISALGGIMIICGTMLIIYKGI
ncbi:MAG: EamA family transporter [Rhodospirillales bacterium]|nr:EamA family transporter [Alphaproteobacteria bacterium]MCB9980926.1 EamA family transporter [Rhodospirillales bacterium]